MARVDDYINARSIAVENLSKLKAIDIARLSGFKMYDEHSFIVVFLNRTYRVSYPEFQFADMTEDKADIPIQEQVLVLHYMSALKQLSPIGQWIAYREIPGAAFYFSAFVKRAIDPLKKHFGHNIEKFAKAAAILKGTKIDAGDVGTELWVFPKVPLQIVIHEGDDEFEPEASILFDATAGDFLSPEDAAWAAGMVVYRMLSVK